MIHTDMTPIEKRAAFSLAGIFSLRMMGLFMILPVFALFATDIEGVTPVMIGLAIGIYGLTQALFQIPFGMMSDKFGRKPIIALGLVIFAIGSVVAATADSMMGIIIGRALQGSGAIAAAVMALAADLTREEHRTKAMAVIGMSIGLSFTASLVLGPMLNGVIGVQGIFWLTAILAIGGIFVLKFIVPTPVKSSFHRDAEPVPGYFMNVLKDRQLQRLDYGIASLHVILTSTFIALPFALRDYAGLEVEHHWYVYLPVLLLSLGISIPFIIIAEKKRKIKEVFVAAIAGILIAQLGLVFFYDSLWAICLLLACFFIAFNTLEALLPSLIAKFSPADKKGTAMGVYSTSQFLGAFVGGLLGGAIYGWFDLPGVFFFCTVVAGAWFFVARTMEIPRFLANFMLHVGDIQEDQVEKLEYDLKQVKGVVEALYVEEEGTAYLKVDNRELDGNALEQFVEQVDDSELGIAKDSVADDAHKRVPQN
ncbi:MAG: MFS transporter [Gammaproteobacteria bacterium]|nr:MFS transporter [Gammaproteobacteria bacterium]